LCAWDSTGVPVWQPAADIRDRCSSMSPLCWHHDTTSAVNSSSYPRRPHLSGGCSACMEQSATRDSGLLLTFDIPEGDQVAPFSSVIRLTWHRLHQSRIKLPPTSWKNDTNHCPSCPAIISSSFLHHDKKINLLCTSIWARQSVVKPVIYDSLTAHSINIHID